MNIKRMEAFVAGILRFGVIISGIIISIGIALLIVSGNQSCPFGIITIEWILRGEPFQQPSHILFLGFLILVGTPLIRVSSSVLVYGVERDWIYVAITGTVLTVLIAGITLGVG